MVHKILTGLLTTHELLGSRPALHVAVELANHVQRRVARLLAKGLEVWQDFINQEVGGMSEALADLARITGNSTWLQLAGMFERPCFFGALARGAASEAIEKVHVRRRTCQPRASPCDARNLSHGLYAGEAATGQYPPAAAPRRHGTIRGDRR